MSTDAMFSSATDLWETPQWFFNMLNGEFHFTLDPCSTHENAKCEKHYTAEEDGLSKNWAGNTVFVNPPYISSIQDRFVRKCREESEKPGTIVVALLPARTDTKRFHRYIINQAEIHFLEGRLVFEMDGKPILGKNGRPQSAPFPSMICVFGRSVHPATPQIL